MTSSLRPLRPLLTHTTGIQQVNLIRLSAFNHTMRRSYTATPQQASGHNPLLWIGCISLGVAYTYYEKKQTEKSAVKAESQEEPSSEKSKHVEESCLKTEDVPKANEKAIEKSK